MSGNTRRCAVAAALAAALHMTPAGAEPGAGVTYTEVEYTDQTLIVTAGAPGSLRITTTPGSGAAGPTIRCGWFEVIVGGQRPISIIDVVTPEVGETYLLNCWVDEPVVPFAGYPIAAVYPGTGALAGGAVSTAEAARHAVEHLPLAAPTVALSPPGPQIVGIPSWLAVTSRLDYDAVSAQAGPVWATVRPVFRDALWRVDNGDTVRCTDDATTTWSDEIVDDSTCRYVFSVAGDEPRDVTVTVRWTIYERTDKTGGTWRVWGTAAITTGVSIEVGDLQAAIRWMAAADREEFTFSA